LPPARKHNSVRWTLGTLAFVATGFDIASDGKFIVYTRVDSLDSDIMLVENFH